MRELEVCLRGRLPSSPECPSSLLESLTASAKLFSLSDMWLLVSESIVNTLASRQISLHPGFLCVDCFWQIEEGFLPGLLDACSSGRA